MKPEGLEKYDPFDFEGPLEDSSATDNPRQVTKDVWVGGAGPPVLLLQELPGIESKTICLAKKLNTDGFRVYMPHLLGPMGKRRDIANTLRMMCMRREFSAWATHRSSPIIHWLRALCVEIQEREDCSRIGVIGMCLTGNFALNLLAEDGVVAGVAAQPALPMIGTCARASLHMSPQEILDVQAGMAKQGGRGVAMRFAGDKMSAVCRLNMIEALFAPHVTTHEIEGDKHSLLTHDFRPEAYDLVRNLLRDQLKSKPEK